MENNYRLPGFLKTTLLVYFSSGGCH